MASEKIKLIMANICFITDLYYLFNALLKWFICGLTDEIRRKSANATTAEAPTSELKLNGILD
jgi:hypothetical protein